MSAAEILADLFGDAETQPNQKGFNDVKSGDYFYDAVNWAVEKGITTGTSATTFSPNASCTRAQIVTFLWRASGQPGAEDCQQSLHRRCSQRILLQGCSVGC